MKKISLLLLLIILGIPTLWTQKAIEKEITHLIERDNFWRNEVGCVKTICDGSVI